MTGPCGTHHPINISLTIRTGMSSMQKSQVILRNSALRDIEHQQHTATPPLMERAGRAAAQLALQLQSGTNTTLPPLIVAGPGNNGGDAFVVARLLREAGQKPILVFVGEADALPPDASSAYKQWIASGGIVLNDMPLDPKLFGFVVDGLFGIGLKRPLEGRYATLVKRINALDCPVLALDIPSGIDSETGCILGIAVRASHTATFIALKPGLLTLDGPDHCGTVSVHDLDLASSVCVIVDGASISPDLFIDELRPRAMNSHKGSYGNAAILGGAAGMAGAALLSGRAALALGAGRVHVGMLERLIVDPQQPELMLRPADEAMTLATALAIGPGLGQSDAALKLLRQAIDSTLPILIDADAINLLATHPVLRDKLKRRSGHMPQSLRTLLTPHPAEAARLLGTDVATVQSDRLAAAITLASDCNAAILLKGCGSIVALPDGRWYINTTGNPGLATAGSGDVLSGMALALLAQGWSAAHALLAATHLHGAAADACVTVGIGPIGLCASELIAPARQLLNQWTRHASQPTALLE